MLLIPKEGKNNVGSEIQTSKVLSLAKVLSLILSIVPIIG